MRKISVFNHISLDGFFEGVDHDMSWMKHDQESNDFANQQIGSANNILFGRVTFEMMASYWPTPAALRDNPIVAGYMNNTPKYVVSNTLTQTDWQNTSIIRGNVLDEIKNLKQQPGEDMIIFGSGELVSDLTRHGLIDEYQIMLNPLVVGEGTPLFHGVGNKVHLELVNSRRFNNGNVLLVYQLRD